jgi:hypothetical protein
LFVGALAQLGERLVCNQEVAGSIPVRSISLTSKSWQPRQLCLPERQRVAVIDLRKAPPPKLLRLIVALVLATFFAFELLRIYQQFPDHHTDFNIVWLGAKAMLSGGDPYMLVGPGKELDFRWPATYPATAMLLVSPLTLLSEHAATMVFVWLSTFALVYGITRDGWYLLPMLASEAFFSSVHLGQWSILLTAALFLPLLQVVVVAKPHTGISIIAGSQSRQGLMAAVIAGVCLTVASLIILPGWPLEWFAIIRNMQEMKSPVLAFGGPFILLVLLRWRRKESWLIVSMALLPQNWGWYATLPLLSVGKNFRESALLSIVSTLGIIAGGFLPGTEHNIGAMLVATAYLPAVIVVLRRANETEPGGLFGIPFQGRHPLATNNLGRS